MTVSQLTDPTLLCHCYPSEMYPHLHPPLLTQLSDYCKRDNQTQALKHTMG